MPQTDQKPAHDGLADYIEYSGLDNGILAKCQIVGSQDNMGVLIPYGEGNVKLISTKNGVITANQWATGGNERLLVGVATLARKAETGAPGSVILVEGETSAFVGGTSNPGWVYYLGSSGVLWPKASDDYGKRIAGLLTGSDVYVWPRRKDVWLTAPAGAGQQPAVVPAAPIVQDHRHRWIPTVYDWAEKTGVRLRGVICGGYGPFAGECSTVNEYLEEGYDISEVSYLHKSDLLCGAKPAFRSGTYKAGLRPGSSYTPRVWYKSRRTWPAQDLEDCLRRLLAASHRPEEILHISA